MFADTLKSALGGRAIQVAWIPMYPDVQRHQVRELRVGGIWWSSQTADDLWGAIHNYRVQHDR